MTLEQWNALYESTSTTLRLPELYLSGPRVRAKIWIAKSITMGELLGGEAIFRQRISEIVGVAIDRVLIEYLETTALQEADRGSWAVSVGVSALVPPAEMVAPSNASRIIGFVDIERHRLLQLLLYGGIVRGANVTISSLQLFGTPMRVMSAHLDGENFYMVDTTPWVGVNMVLATDTTSSTSVVASVSSGASLAAFRNLRLRFLFADVLHRLQLDTSSILVRESFVVDKLVDVYGASTVLLPVEIHVGDSASLRSAIDGYLRNASLTAALQQVVPELPLLAIEVDDGADKLGENNVSAALRPTNTSYATDPKRFAVQFQVENLPLTHVQRRHTAILDNLRALLSLTLGAHTFEVSCGSLSIIPASVSTATTSTTALVLSDDSVFSISGANDADSLPPPIARPFVLRIVVTSTIDSPVAAAQIHSALLSFASTVDARVAMGFLEMAEMALSSYAPTRVSYVGTTSLLPEDVVVDGIESVSASVGVSFVQIRLILAARGGPEPVVDTFALYRIRAALLLVLEPVLVSDEDVSRVEAASVGASRGLSVEIVYDVRLQDEMQRRGVRRALQSGRFRAALDDYTENAFDLVDQRVVLHADGSPPDRFTIPGANGLVTVGDQPGVSSTSGSPVGSIAPPDTMYLFADPVYTAPGTATLANASCPSFMWNNDFAPAFHGCVVLRWLSEFPSQSVLLRSVTVTNGAIVRSSTIAFPPATLRGNLATANVSAPWIPESTASITPHEWALQILSGAINQTTVTLSFEFADGTTFYPAFQLAAELTLADTRVAASQLQVHSLRRGPSTLLPPSYASAPAFLVKRLEHVVVVGPSVANEPPAVVRATLALGQRSMLGFVDPSAAISLWEVSQPQCLSCLSLMEACDQLAECSTIGQCFRATLNERVLLFGDLLQIPQSLDLSSRLRSCLSSPSYRERQWSTAGRAAFASSLKCLVQASCRISESAPLGTKLSLHYEPPTQVIRVSDTHFPLSLSFLLDVNGGSGNAPDGRTMFQTYDSITELNAETLSHLRVVVLSLYAELTRGMDVEVTTQSPDPLAAGETQIRIQYFFVDVGVAGLPFISVATRVDDPEPTIEAMAAETLSLVSAFSV